MVMVMAMVVMFFHHFVMTFMFHHAGFHFVLFHIVLFHLILSRDSDDAEG